MKTVESSAVFQPKQWAEKEARKTIENSTQAELVPNQAHRTLFEVSSCLIIAPSELVEQRDWAGS